MNLPNYITLGRIVIVPLLVVVLLTPAGETWFGINGYALAIVIFLIASLTDIVDGQLARRRNQVSNLGKLLDPIADKLLVSAAPSPTPNCMPSTVPGPITDVDLVGLLIGDVTGNWNPAIHPRQEGFNAEGDTLLADGHEPIEKITIDLLTLAAAAGNEIIIPVNVQGVAGKDVISYEFDLRYDPKVIVPHAELVVAAGTVSRGLFVVANPYEPLAESGCLWCAADR